jgi:hypothetical protein
VGLFLGLRFCGTGSGTGSGARLGLEFGPQAQR